MIKKLFKFFFIILLILLTDKKDSFSGITINRDKSISIPAYEAANKGFISLRAMSLSGIDKPKVYITNKTNSVLNIDFSSTAFMPEKSDGQRLGLTKFAKLNYSISPYKSKVFEFDGLCLDKNRITQPIKLNYSYIKEAIPESIASLLRKNASQEKVWEVTDGLDYIKWKSMDSRNKKLFNKRLKEIQEKTSFISIKNKTTPLYQKILNDVILEKEIRNISFSENNGSVIFGKDNTLWTSNIPKEAEKKLKELNEKKILINSISFNKNNGWVIIYDDNKTESSKITKELKDLLNSIQERKLKIKNLAFSPNGGWVLSYGYNGLSYSNFPIETVKFIEDLTYFGIKIKNISFTKDYGWVIVFGNNDFAHSDLPENVKNKLYELFNKNKTIKNIAFAPSGDWIITEK